MARRRTLVPAPAGPGAIPLPGVMPARAVAAPGPELFQARVRDTWRFIRRQRASFWLVNLYMFLEYVRPQTMYSWLNVLPWSMIVIVSCLLVRLSEGGKWRRWTVADTGMVLFTGVVFASCAVAYDPAYALRFENISIYVSWLLVYFLISNIVDTEEKFFVFLLAFLLYNLKMSQHVMKIWVGSGGGFSYWAAVGAPGWFHNPGELAIEMVMFLPLSLYFYQALRPHWSKIKQWFFLFLPFSALVALVAASSRGAQLAAGAVFLWLLLKSRYKIRGVALALAMGAVVYLALPAKQRERFTEMGDDKTSEARLELWTHGIEIARNHPVLGIGYKNWIPYYRRNYVVGGQLPHNIFVEAGAELGYTGLAALLFLITASFRVNHQTRRLVRPAGARGKFVFLTAHGLDAALIGYMVAGFFVTVLYYPFLWVNLAMTVALHGAARRQFAGTGSSAGRRGRGFRQPIPLPGAPRA